MRSSRYADRPERATRWSLAMRYARVMATRIAVMPMPQLISLINEWGTMPRTLDPREGGDDPALTALADDFHPIFASADPAERAALITALLDRAGVRPILTAADGALSE